MYSVRLLLSRVFGEEKQTSSRGQIASSSLTSNFIHQPDCFRTLRHIYNCNYNLNWCSNQIYWVQMTSLLYICKSSDQIIVSKVEVPTGWWQAKPRWKKSCADIENKKWNDRLHVFFFVLRKSWSNEIEGPSRRRLQQYIPIIAVVLSKWLVDETRITSAIRNSI